MMILNHTVIRYSNQWKTIAINKLIPTVFNLPVSSASRAFADDLLFVVPNSQQLSKHI